VLSLLLFFIFSCYFCVKSSISSFHLCVFRFLLFCCVLSYVQFILFHIFPFPVSLFFYRVEIYLSPSTKNRGILPFCPFSREKIFCVCFFSALLLFRFCFPSCPSPFFSLFFCVVYEGKIIISPFSFLNFLSNNKS